MEGVIFEDGSIETSFSRTSFHRRKLCEIGSERIAFTLGSVISISPLCSMICSGLDADFAKPPSNDFNRLGGK
jgi:hypothetical protein